ncbi:MAG: hotdog fold thioesterase [bacterium]
MTGVTGQDDDALASKVVAMMLARDAFSRWLGIELVAVQPGRCVLKLRVREDMLNGFGVSHGGVVYSLADSAMAFACNSGPMVTVAVDNQVSYPAAVHAGDELVVTAIEESATGRLGFYGATVRNQDGVVVALFRGTVYRTKRPHLSDSSS